MIDRINMIYMLYVLIRNALFYTDDSNKVIFSILLSLCIAFTVVNYILLIILNKIKRTQ